MEGLHQSWATLGPVEKCSVPFPTKGRAHAPMSRPMSEAESRACASGRAITRTIGHQAQIETLQRSAGADPVADLGVARIESRARQLLQRVGVLLAERADHLAVELFVDREMAEAARGHDADAQVFGIALDRLANRQ